MVDNAKITPEDGLAKQKGYRLYSTLNPIAHMCFAAAIFLFCFFYLNITVIYDTSQEFDKIEQLSSNVMLPIVMILFMMGGIIHTISRIKLGGWKLYFHMLDTPNIIIKKLKPYIFALKQEGMLVT